jgi:hypothetical protein
MAPRRRIRPDRLAFLCPIREDRESLNALLMKMYKTAREYMARVDNLPAGGGASGDEAGLTGLTRGLVANPIRGQLMSRVRGRFKV